jgi:hypothetical protein
MSVSVQVFGRRYDKAIHALRRRRPKNANAGNRGKWAPEVPRALLRFGRSTRFECRVGSRRVYWFRRHAQLRRYGMNVAKEYF